MVFKEFKDIGVGTRFRFLKDSQTIFMKVLPVEQNNRKADCVIVDSYLSDHIGTFYSSRGPHEQVWVEEWKIPQIAYTLRKEKN